MGDREAQIKISVKGDGIGQGLRKAASDAPKAGKEVGEGFVKGLDSAISKIKGFGRDWVSPIKSAFNGVMSAFGADFGFAGMVQGAMKAGEGYRKLGFAIQAGTGHKADIQGLQREIEKLAIDTGMASADITGHFQNLFSKSGDLDFTKSAMKDIATAARASGAPMGTLVELVDGVNGAFGVTAEQVPDVLAQMLSLSSRSGVGLEDFAAKFEMVGAAANKAGLQGVEGLTATAALVTKADASLGGMKKAIPAVTALLDTLGSKADRSQAFTKLGINAQNFKGNAIDALKQVVAKTGGKREEIEKAFGGEQAKFLVDLGSEYADAFAKSEGDMKTKTRAGLDAFDAALRQAGQSQMSAAQVADAAADAMKSPQAKIDQAMETMAQAFTNPAMLSAITDLAALLPGLAKAISGAIKKTVEIGDEVLHFLNADNEGQMVYTDEAGGGASAAENKRFRERHKSAATKFGENMMGLDGDGVDFAKHTKGLLAELANMQGMSPEQRKKHANAKAMATVYNASTGKDEFSQERYDQFTREFRDRKERAELDDPDRVVADPVKYQADMALAAAMGSGRGIGRAAPALGAMKDAAFGAQPGAAQGSGPGAQAGGAFPKTIEAQIKGGRMETTVLNIDAFAAAVRASTGARAGHEAGD